MAERAPVFFPCEASLRLRTLLRTCCKLNDVGIESLRQVIQLPTPTVGRLVSQSQKQKVRLEHVKPLVRWLAAQICCQPIHVANWVYDGIITHNTVSHLATAKPFAHTLTGAHHFNRWIDNMRPTIKCWVVGDTLPVRMFDKGTQQALRSCAARGLVGARHHQRVERDFVECHPSLHFQEYARDVAPPCVLITYNALYELLSGTANIGLSDLDASAIAEGLVEAVQTQTVELGVIDDRRGGSGEWIRAYLDRYDTVVSCDAQFSVRRTRRSLQRFGYVADDSALAAEILTQDVAARERALRCCIYSSKDPNDPRSPKSRETLIDWLQSFMLDDSDFMDYEDDDATQ